VGAYDFTHAATHTGVVVEPQGGHVGKVSKVIHKMQTLLLVIEDENEEDYQLRGIVRAVVLVLGGDIYPANADPTQAASASNRAAACSGIALRISFSTPDGEVNGVDPVKFIAR
jgi:hypothetical protein